MTHAFRILLVAAILFAVVMALMPQPPIIIPSDKWQHAVTFAALTLLALLAYPAAPLALVGERLAFLGAMIEVGQAIPALGRQAEAVDWLADAAGILIALGLAATLRRMSDRAPT